MCYSHLQRQHGCVTLIWLETRDPRGATLSQDHRVAFDFNLVENDSQSLSSTDSPSFTIGKKNTKRGIRVVGIKTKFYPVPLEIETFESRV